MRHTFLQKLQIALVKLSAMVTWRENDRIPEESRITLRKMFAENYFIVVTRRDNYLSSWLMNFGHFLLTGRWGYYTHVLMNTEDEVANDADFRFIEAVGDGTKYSTLEEILDGIESIALLKPKSLTVEEWTECLDRAKTYLGRPYDNLFNLVNGEEINCVELVRNALMALPDYGARFADFENLIRKKKGKLTPTMFFECTDFQVVWQTKS